MASLTWYRSVLIRIYALAGAFLCLLSPAAATAETLRYKDTEHSVIQRFSGNNNQQGLSPYAIRRKAILAQREEATIPQLLDSQPPPTPPPQPKKQAQPLKIMIPNLQVVHRQTPVASPVIAPAPIQSAARSVEDYQPTEEIVAESVAATPVARASAVVPQQRKAFALNVGKMSPSLSLPAALPLQPTLKAASHTLEDIVARTDDEQPETDEKTAKAKTFATAVPVERRREELVGPGISQAQRQSPLSPQLPDPARVARETQEAREAEALRLASLSPAAGPASSPQAPLIETPAIAAPTVLPALPATEPLKPAAAVAMPTPLMESSSPSHSFMDTALPVHIAPPPPTASVSPSVPLHAGFGEMALDQIVAQVTKDDAIAHKSNEAVAKPTQRQAAKPVQKPAVPVIAEDPTEPQQGLSPATRKIAGKLPSNLDKRKKSGSESIVIDRTKDYPPQGKDESINVSEEGNGFSIKVNNTQRRVNLDYELEKAYNALISGETMVAIEIYKRVLEADPSSHNALFGLATTYHRAGQIDLARPLYAKLLALDPKNRDALNNFLVLMADEAPEQALIQLSQLEKRNPDFSPIPAQMAVIYQKLGDSDKASEKMFRAIALAPENLVYRYNLAIMLDKQKKYEEAAKLYKQLVDASMRGEVIPGNLQKIQERLTFISSNRP